MMTAKRSREETAIIEALQMRLQQAQQRLAEAQSMESRASVTALAQRTRRGPLSEAHETAKLTIERLEQERERSRRYQHKLCSDIEVAHSQLKELTAKTREFRGASRQVYDGLQDELQGVIDHLAEVCSKNGELRQQLRLCQSVVAEPGAIEDRAPWIGLGLAGQAVTPRASSAGTPLARSPATASTCGTKARAATVQLQEEVARMETNVLRERERAAQMTRRLEVLRKRERQLEASLQRDREEGDERKQHLEVQLQKSYEQISRLMELAASPPDRPAPNISQHTASMAATTPSAIVQVSRCTSVEERPAPRLSSGGSSGSRRPMSCRSPPPGGAGPIDQPDQPSQPMRRAGASSSGGLRRAVAPSAREGTLASNPLKQESLCGGPKAGSCDPAGISLQDAEEQEASGDLASPHGAGGTGGTGGGAPDVPPQTQTDTVAERIVRLTSRVKASNVQSQSSLSRGRLASSPTQRSSAAAAQRSCSGGTSRHNLSARAVSARDGAAQSTSVWGTPLRSAWAHRTSSTQRRTTSGAAAACSQR